MKLYISGPMSSIGPPDYNRPAFARAAEVLRAAGHEVVNPAEADDPKAIDEEILEFGLTVVWCRTLARDIGYILLGGIDAVVCLPGWEESDGSRLELAAAYYAGIPMLEYADGGLSPCPRVLVWTRPVWPVSGKVG